MNTQKLLDALRQIKYKAVSLADAQVIALETLAEVVEQEQWIVVKEHTWDHGDGGRPTLAYLWPSEFNTQVFPSFDEAHSFMKEHSLPIGFVAMKL